MDRWIGGWTDEMKNGEMGRWMDGWMGGWMDGWMDGRVRRGDGWMGGWTVEAMNGEIGGGWMDAGRTKERAFQPIILPSHHSTAPKKMRFAQRHEMAGLPVTPRFPQHWTPREPGPPTQQPAGPGLSALSLVWGERPASPPGERRRARSHMRTTSPPG